MESIYTLAELDLYTPAITNNQTIYSSLKYYFETHQQLILDKLKSKTSIPIFNTDLYNDLKKDTPLFFKSNELNLFINENTTDYLMQCHKDIYRSSYLIDGKLYNINIEESNKGNKEPQTIFDSIVSLNLFQKHTETPEYENIPGDLYDFKFNTELIESLTLNQKNFIANVNLQKFNKNLSILHQGYSAILIILTKSLLSGLNILSSRLIIKFGDILCCIYIISNMPQEAMYAPIGYIIRIIDNSDITDENNYYLFNLFCDYNNGDNDIKNYFEPMFNLSFNINSIPCLARRDSINPVRLNRNFLLNSDLKCKTFLEKSKDECNYGDLLNFPILQNNTEVVCDNKKIELFIKGYIVSNFKAYTSAIFVADKHALTQIFKFSGELQQFDVIAIKFNKIIVYRNSEYKYGVADINISNAFDEPYIYNETTKEYDFSNLSTKFNTNVINYYFVHYSPPPPSINNNEYIFDIAELKTLINVINCLNKLIYDTIPIVFASYLFIHQVIAAFIRFFLSKHGHIESIIKLKRSYINNNILYLCSILIYIMYNNSKRSERYNVNEILSSFKPKINKEIINKLISAYNGITTTIATSDTALDINSMIYKLKDQDPEDLKKTLSELSLSQAQVIGGSKIKKHRKHTSYKRNFHNKIKKSSMIKHYNHRTIKTLTSSYRKKIKNNTKKH
jgi:hypothetical protein